MKTIYHSILRALLVLSALPAFLSLRVASQGLNPYGPPTGPQVMLHVYSGMKNPVFELTPADVARITDLVSKLPDDTAAAGDTVIPANIGYTGFTVGQLPAAKADQYVVVRVYRKGVE